MAAITNTNANARMLYFTVIVAVITSQFLSAQALRCHQCNSHLYEDCTDLRLTTPRAQRDDQFLKECHPENNAAPFCRKVLLEMEVTKEKRIVRECGWISDPALNATAGSCISGEHVGYKETVCVCSTDGCNGSSTLSTSKTAAVGMIALFFGAAAVLRRN